MDKATGKLTVFFKEPFWVGVFEHTEDEKLSVCKVTFGSEPKDYEILDFISKNYYCLKFSPSVDVITKEKRVNPKKMQRIATKQLTQSGIGKKSWQALQLQREELKTERKQISKEQREAEKQRQFQIKQQKRKKKHRGK